MWKIILLVVPMLFLCFSADADSFYRHGRTVHIHKHYDGYGYRGYRDYNRYRSYYYAQSIPRRRGPIWSERYVPGHGDLRGAQCFYGRDGRLFYKKPGARCFNNFREHLHNRRR